MPDAIASRIVSVPKTRDIKRILSGEFFRWKTPLQPNDVKAMNASRSFEDEAFFLSLTGFDRYRQPLLT
jgi:hypothetical protein